MGDITILLADDHQITRDGLRHLIEQQPKLKVIAETDNGQTAVKLAKEKAPMVVVMDVSMPGMNGMEATRQIIMDSPNIKVLALSMHSHRTYVVGMLKAGASGYLLKNCAFDELVTAIATILKNRIYISPAISDVVMEDYLKRLQVDKDSPHVELTSREREVLQLIAEGMKTKEIAARLCIGMKTVEAHRKQIMDKLQIHSIAKLTKYALQEGLTTLDM